MEEINRLWGIKQPGEKRERDSRRSFTETQKKEILHQQDYKCARCHKKLDLRTTEFDHKKPWAAGGRTVRVNGRALCSYCHKLITHKARLKKVDRKRRAQPKGTYWTNPFTGKKEPWL
jgi:nitrate/TMAO reductase-like tetraheme cytochrome c subunit